MSAPQSPIQAALAAEREQWTGPTRTCDALGVCQDRQPSCKGCKQSEGARTVQTLLRELSKRPELPLVPAFKK